MKIRRVLILATCILSAVLDGTAQTAQTNSTHRFIPLALPAQGRTGFSLLSPSQTGITFTNQLAQSRSLTNQIYLNGSGVAAGDVDGDGWCDLYLCGLDNRNELYRNLGNWRFEAITDAAGIACADQASTGAAFADIDGDDDLDLIVNGIARGTRLFLNDGRAKFTEVTQTAGLQHRSGSMSLAIADVNADGLLDIYVVNYRNSTFRDEPEKRFRVVPRAGKYEVTLVDGRPTTEPDLVGRFTVDPQFGLMEHGEPDILFINQGNAKFRPVQWGDGTFLSAEGTPTSAPYDWGLSAMFRDLNNDLAPDLYVCNDFQSPDRIWLNESGKFRSISSPAFRQTSLFSMGVDFADLDGDGREEIFVADMLSRIHERRQIQVMDGMAAKVPDRKLEVRPQYTRNTLFWNRGNGTYAEVAQLAGLDATEWSWCPAFIDVDLDGRRDLLVTTGHERDAQHIDVAREIDAAKARKAPWRELVEMRRKFPRLDSPILAFQNRGALQFTNATADWGFSTSQIAHGLALADLDNDGDLDLVANALHSPALIYRNDSIQPRFAIRLRGNSPNTASIGAQIAVEIPGLPLQTDQLIAGGRYLSGDSFVRTFAAQGVEKSTITVRWPAGGVTRITNAPPNHLVEISERSSTPQLKVAKQEIVALFQNASAQLNHRHHDESFDDFQRQLLLPRKYSELGPPVCWFDLDGDSWEDLFVGSGRGGKLAAFKNNRGQLTAWKLPFTSQATPQDHTAIIGFVSGTNRTLLVSFSNYETTAPTNSGALKQYDRDGKLVAEFLPGHPATIGTLAAGDPDGDGDTDIFVGSRIIPGRYPESPGHVFLRNENGTLTNAASTSATLRNAGMVSSATWANLDEDPRPELLLAIDGGPIRIYSLAQNNFVERTSEFGLDQYLGWWQSISNGDFNHDGSVDIVAGNLGRNSKYQKFMPGQYSLFYGEFSGNSVQLIEAFRDPRTGKHFPLFDRDSLAVNMPELTQRYPTFTAFSTASVEEFLGAGFPKAQTLRINTTESIVFINDGKRFRAHPLPLQAQFSPIMGIAVADANADGKLDLFASQNLYSAGKNTSRYDAGEGLLLIGDGKGNFQPIPSQESGIQLTGEGRGTAFCDFDHDNRMDLVVGQNSGTTLLFRNASPQRTISNQQ